jgi:hypothetical protein
MSARGYILMSLPTDKGPTVPCEGCKSMVAREVPYRDNVTLVCPRCAARVMGAALAGGGPIPAVYARPRAVEALHAYLSEGGPIERERAPAVGTRAEDAPGPGGG